MNEFETKLMKSKAHKDSCVLQFPKPYRGTSVKLDEQRKQILVVRRFKLSNFFRRPTGPLEGPNYSSISNKIIIKCMMVVLNLDRFVINHYRLLNPTCKFHVSGLSMVVVKSSLLGSVHAMRESHPTMR